MSPVESILTRIKKLQALTVERGATVDEAAAAAAKIQCLLFEYNLSMSQVDTHELGGPIESIENISVTMAANRNTVGWKRTLLYVIAQSNFCSSVYIPNSTRCQVIGKRHNVQVVEYMAASIGAEIERLSKAASKGELYNRSSYAISFCRGAVSTISRRLKEQERKNESASAACTALVVQSKGEIEAAVKQFFPRLISSRSSRVRNSDGYHAGRAAGNSIGLNRGVTSADRQRIG